MQAGRSAGPAPSWLFHGARPRFAAFAAGAVAATGQAPLGWWPLTLIGFWAIFHIALAAPRPGTAARLIWLAGGGIRGGQTIGATDEFGYYITEDPVHVHDLQATILHLLGMDPHGLSFPFQGLDKRLIGPTDAPEVVSKLLA